MTHATLLTSVALGAMTGMRSMTGLATLAARRGGLPLRIIGLAAAAEMILDKTSLLGDRIDPLPLAGRALIGAAVGGLAASERDARQVIAGGLLGATAAIAVTHLAYQLRRRLPVSSLVGGALEDALVMSLAYRLGVGTGGPPHLVD